MRKSNLLFILSDEHAHDALGVAGHPAARTPNLDALAARGTRFTNAYTTCPICVPARASLATGRYVHEIGNWDNAFPYDGSVPGWAHRLREHGHRVDAIGKLHFRSEADDYGFTHVIDPLYVVDGIGDLQGAIRHDAPVRHKRGGIEEAGPGDSGYLRYDRSNADRACRWIAEQGASDRPWVLFLSFVCPHPPYIAPPALFEEASSRELPWPPQSHADEWPRHPTLDGFRRFFDFDRPFDDATRRRLLAAYHAVCTYLDAQIGRVLTALDEAGLGDTTRVIYTSDHGECLGARGIFGKFTMYDESAAVPMLIAGPEVPVGATVSTPVSLVDVFPSVLECVGVPSVPDLPGRSLWSTARDGEAERTVFAEYHAVGSTHASYMLRDGRYKYVHYVSGPPQLFDMANDPDETRDLAGSAEHRALLGEFERRLRTMIDPEGVDARAKADQAALVASFGGREAVLRRGTFDNSPVPGETARFG